jgi:SNF2-related domain
MLPCLLSLSSLGVDPTQIYQFAAKDSHQPFKGACYVLCNRYDLQTEVRHIFTNLGHNKAKPKTVLFPNASKQLLLVMKNQYLANQGKEMNRFKPTDKEEKYNPNKLITRFLSSKHSQVEPCFRTIVIDEAHFLKSLTAYWGIGAGLIGLHAERMIPMSGTPYNNGCQDLATLMTMIDPSSEAAYEDWWKEATKEQAATKVAMAISEWSKNFVIRRDKSVIAANLPQKLIRIKQVAPYPLELAVYVFQEMVDGMICQIY